MSANYALNSWKLNSEYLSKIPLDASWLNTYHLTVYIN